MEISGIDAVSEIAVGREAMAKPVLVWMLQSRQVDMITRARLLTL